MKTADGDGDRFLAGDALPNDYEETEGLYDSVLDDFEETPSRGVDGSGTGDRKDGIAEGCWKCWWMVLRRGRSGVGIEDGKLVDADDSTDGEEECGSGGADVRSFGFDAAPGRTESSESNLVEEICKQNHGKAENNQIEMNSSKMDAFLSSESDPNCVGTKDNDEETTKRSGVDNWELSSHAVHCVESATGLSYISSQEPGIQSQATALCVVDEFLFENDLGLSQDDNNGKASILKSPPTANLKRSQVFARVKPCLHDLSSVIKLGDPEVVIVDTNKSNAEGPATQMAAEAIQALVCGSIEYEASVDGEVAQNVIDSSIGQIVKPPILMTPSRQPSVNETCNVRTSNVYTSPIACRTRHSKAVKLSKLQTINHRNNASIFELLKKLFLILDLVAMLAHITKARMNTETGVSDDKDTDRNPNDRKMDHIVLKNKACISKTDSSSKLGRSVFITPRTKPNQDLIYSLVTAAQGQPLKQLGRFMAKKDKLPDDLLILSSEEDFAACVPYLEKEQQFSAQSFYLMALLSRSWNLQGTAFFWIKLRRHAQRCGSEVTMENSFFQ
ncbi:hypothetical protein HPP92_016881 [Vanilla planifolia]|uniref:Uncharacterized protein n=1 Tax=Vanilla planifolia TaxID=51239 RepID=A0A835QBQ5_VANPL|nr:hypothetical protein HPP92_016881 [Vanilla planifolia]